ncbi:MAG: hypothetical protein J7L99_05100 [Planctomycetes bacterium]|nr:hypothetical protein [Planctomycetota bacterium]
MADGYYLERLHVRGYHYGLSGSPIVRSMRMIHIKCPKCGDFLSVPESIAGQTVTCPNCGNVSVVPQPEAGKNSNTEHKEVKLSLGEGFDFKSREAKIAAWASVLVCCLLGTLIGAEIGTQHDATLVGGWIGFLGGFIIGMLVGSLLGLIFEKTGIRVCTLPCIG